MFFSGLKSKSLGSMNVGIKMDNAEEIMAIRFPLSIYFIGSKDCRWWCAHSAPALHRRPAWGARGRVRPGSNGQHQCLRSYARSSCSTKE
jgi:hypothetical protein